MQSLQFFSSNRVEALYEQFRDDLYSQKTPFAKRLVVVPSPAMKNWLLLRLASDPSIQVAAGLQICYLDQAVEMLHKKNFSWFPDQMELSFLFEGEIRRLIGIWQQNPQNVSAEWSPLITYLKIDPHLLSSRTERRLIGLCEQLSSLFLQYGKYSCAMLSHWESKPSEGEWQASLWHLIKQKYPHLDFLYRFPNGLKDSLQDLQLYLFAVSFIPQRAYDFLLKASSTIPIHHYWLTPCQLFWSDVCSERERTKLQQFWSEKGASKAQLKELDRFLRENNALLANFGKIGRAMAKNVEESEAPLQSCFYLSEGVQNFPCYVEAISLDLNFDPSFPFSLLHAIQADIALLRNPNLKKISFPKTDLSIQLHSAPTQFREIQILYNVFLKLLDQDPCLTPSDIVVMLPNLPEYEAIIQSVFGAKNSLLDFQITESQLLIKSSLVRSFLHFLRLGQSRWDADIVTELLEFPEFQRKHHFSKEDVQLIQNWIQQAGIYWGLHDSHRNELLSKDHSGLKMLDSPPSGTWKHGFSRLLTTFAVESEGLDDSQHAFPPPLDTIEASQVDLIDKWLKIFYSFQSDLHILSNDSRLTLKEWISHLEYLLETYFQINPHEKKEAENHACLIRHFQALKLATSHFIQGEEPLFSFESIFTRFKKALEDDRSCYRESHLQAIRFCSLLPMRAVPSKVIVLAGMQEGSFPRQDLPFSLNAAIGSLHNDYSPSQTDFDRYLFLEAILSTRQSFILSYVGYSFESQCEVPPSLIIQEFFAYLDTGYTLDDNAPSSYCLHKHPYKAFDKSYFTPSATFPSYIQEHYRLAKAHYFPYKNSSPVFIEEFSFSPHLKEIHPIISIQDLRSFASNPLKVYFNRILKIYLSEEKQPIACDEPFELCDLEKYQIRLAGLEASTDLIFEKSLKKGKFPTGLFKTMISNQLTEEITAMRDSLLKNDIDPKTLFSITFSSHCENPSLNNENLVLPPLSCIINGEEVLLTGSLQNVSSEGLVYHQSRTVQNSCKQWPLYLILERAIQIYALPIKAQLISSKPSPPLRFTQQANLLEKYVEYYLSGLVYPSPLLPEWIPTILKEDPIQFSKMLQSDLEGTFSSFYNHYARWIFRDPQKLHSVESIYAQWLPIAKPLFSPILAAFNR